jgi:hypothetical protein
MTVVLFDLIDGHKRKIVGALFTLTAMAGQFGFLSPEQVVTVGVWLSALFGVAQVDAWTGYVGRSGPGK